MKMSIKKCFWLLLALAILGLAPHRACLAQEKTISLRELDIDKLGQSENFKKADAVFVGRVIDSNGSGFERSALGDPGKIVILALVNVTKVFKGDQGKQACVQSIYSFNEYQDVDTFFPYKGDEFLFFGKKQKLLGHINQYKDRFKIQNGSCYTTNKTTGTAKIKH